MISNYYFANSSFNINAATGILLSLKALTICFWTFESITIRNSWWYYTQDPRINVVYNIHYSQDTHIFGYLLYKSYFFVFLLCGFLLLIAMVCSLILVLRGKNKYDHVFL